LLIKLKRCTNSVFVAGCIYTATNTEYQLKTLGLPQQIAHIAATVTVKKLLKTVCEWKLSVQTKQITQCVKVLSLSVTHRRRTNLGRRSFSIAGPSVWNSLPQSLRL